MPRPYHLARVDGAEIPGDFAGSVGAALAETGISTQNLST